MSSVTPGGDVFAVSVLVGTPEMTPFVPTTAKPMERDLSRSSWSSSTSTTTSALALSFASMIFSAMRTLSAVSRMVMALSAFSGKTLRASIMVRTTLVTCSASPLER